MEDNEFEEVTIISHTDRPQRVFSEKSIEKLKDQVSLEIVDRVRKGKTARKTDPRLAPGLRELEKLKQDHFGEGVGMIAGKDVYFISRVAGESGQYLLGAKYSALLSNGQESKLVSVGSAVAENILNWGSQLIVFPTRMPPLIFDASTFNANVLDAPKCLGHASHKVFSTPKHVYYVDFEQKFLISLDRELKATKFGYLGVIQDFFVCPKTETITTLYAASDYQLSGRKFWIQRNDKTIELQKDFEYGQIYILKKMYSDHFLVGETNLKQKNSHALQLWDDRQLTKTHSLVWVNKIGQGSMIQNIRLLAPRQGISCFLVLMHYSLELFCEYRLKLYHLKTQETIDRGLCLSHQYEDAWHITYQKFAFETLVISIDWNKL